MNISLSNPSVPGVLPSNVDSAKNWSNGWRYAIGLEHNFSDKYAAMAGFAFDEALYNARASLRRNGNKAPFIGIGNLLEDLMAGFSLIDAPFQVGTLLLSADRAGFCSSAARDAHLFFDATVNFPD